MSSRETPTRSSRCQGRSRPRGRSRSRCRRCASHRWRSSRSTRCCQCQRGRRRNLDPTSSSRPLIGQRLPVSVAVDLGAPDVEHDGESGVDLIRRRPGVRAVDQGWGMLAGRSPVDAEHGISRGVTQRRLGSLWPVPGGTGADLHGKVTAVRPRQQRLGEAQLCAAVLGQPGREVPQCERRIRRGQVAHQGRLGCGQGGRCVRDPSRNVGEGGSVNRLGVGAGNADGKRGQCCQHGEHQRGR